MKVAAPIVLLANRRKLRPSLWPVSRNVIIACAGLCGVALTPLSAFAQDTSVARAQTPVKVLNPDTEVILAMGMGAYRLADDITAAPLGGSLCVDVQQVFSALDFPIIIDRSRNVASGWFINEAQSFNLDLSTGSAKVGAKAFNISPSSISAVSTGSCVTIDALSSLLGLTLEYLPNGSALSVTSVQRLPLIDRLERQSRTRIDRGISDLENAGPRVASLPYRAFVAPNTNVSISFNRQQSSPTKRTTATNWSVLSVGELAYMTAEAQLGTTNGEFNGNISRFRLYRSERDGGVFGNPQLTEFSIGDVSGFGSSLGANSAVGLGFSASTFPISRPTSFDRTNFEGPLPAGWDIELYRNGQLLEFRSDGSTGGYAFRDVPVLFGENNFEIVQYGPQGQRRVINRRINASNFIGPKGSKFYRAAIYRPEILFGKVAEGSGVRIDLKAALGLGANLGLTVGFDSYLLKGERLSIGSLSALTSVSGIALNAELSGTSEGQFAGSLAFQGNGKGASMRGRLILAQDGFQTERLSGGILARFEASADRGFNFGGRGTGTMTGQFTFDRLYSGESSFTARQRVTLARGNSWLAQSLSWSHSSSGERRDQIDGDFGYSHRLGRQSIRAAFDYTVYPTLKINRLSASVERAFGVSADAWRFQAETGWDINERKFNHSLSIDKPFKQLTFGLTAKSDGHSNHSIGVNLSFGFGRRSNGWGMTQTGLANMGTVRARIFEDLDDNGVFSEGDKPVEGANIASSTGASLSQTNTQGFATLGGVSSGARTQINVLTDELDNPNLYGRLTYTKPREGTVSEISIPLTQMGSIEGTITMITGFDPTANPMGGAPLVLIDAQQKEIARTTSAYDGFFTFDLVPAGTYTVALAPDTSLAQRLRPVVPLEVVTTRQEPGVQGRSMTLIETNPTSTRMALRGLL